MSPCERCAWRMSLPSACRAHAALRMSDDACGAAAPPPSHPQGVPHLGGLPAGDQHVRGAVACEFHA
eukprot:350320-Chlamydomonas_euryale.AAC.10